MSTRLEINTESKQDRATLLGVMYALGAIFHRDSGDLTLAQATEQFTDFNICRIEFEGNGKHRISGRKRSTPVLNWSKDPAAVLKALNDAVNQKPEIVIDNVGDYKATITAKGILVGCQTITFDKFQEIVDGVAKYNKQ